MCVCVFRERARAVNERYGRGAVGRERGESTALLPVQAPSVLSPTRTASPFLFSRRRCVMFNALTPCPLPHPTHTHTDLCVVLPCSAALLLVPVLSFVFLVPPPPRRVSLQMPSLPPPSLDILRLLRPAASPSLPPSPSSSSHHAPIRPTPPPPGCIAVCRRSLGPLTSFAPPPLCLPSPTLDPSPPPSLHIRTHP